MMSLDEFHLFFLLAVFVAHDKTRQSFPQTNACFVCELEQ